MINVATVGGKVGTASPGDRRDQYKENRTFQPDVVLPSGQLREVDKCQDGI